MRTAQIYCLSVALGLLGGCRTPVQPGSDSAGPPTSHDVQVTPADPPPPGPLDFDEVITRIEAELGASVYHEGSRSCGPKEGVWREVVVFRVDGEDYCHAITPETEWANCDFVPGVEAIPWSAEEYLGLAVLAYTDPAAPKVEHLRMLGRSCQASDGPCAEELGTTRASSRGASGMTDIAVDRLEVSDVDLDGEVEIELVTTYVELGTLVEGELGDDPDNYSEKIFTRRRLTVLRGDLSRQLDIDIHQEMFEWAPGVYADNDVVSERYELSPEGATVSWCELEIDVALNARECLEQVCASPTTHVRFPYDAKKDVYAKAAPEALRPIVDEWEGCPK